MCRLLAYTGPALALGELVSRPAHSLVAQSYRPREMQSGTVNADGWGAAFWLEDGRPDPALYRDVAPIWADPNLGWMGERLRVRAAVAAVRSATPGIGFELANVQPFVHGRLAFAHNGFIGDFRRGARRALRASLAPKAEEAIEGSGDSEVVFAQLLSGLERGDEPCAALRGALRAVGEVCRALDRKAVITAVLCDGERLLGCRWAAGLAPATLYAAPFPSAAGADDAGWCLASEPLDAGAWREVPPGTLVRAEPGRDLRLEPL